MYIHRPAIQQMIEVTEGEILDICYKYNSRFYLLTKRYTHSFDTIVWDGCGYLILLYMLGQYYEEN